MQIAWILLAIVVMFCILWCIMYALGRSKRVSATSMSIQKDTYDWFEHLLDEGGAIGPAVKFFGTQPSSYQQNVRKDIKMMESKLS